MTIAAREQQAALVAAALDVGVTLSDTAAAYGDGQSALGHSKVVGLGPTIDFAQILHLGGIGDALFGLRERGLARAAGLTAFGGDMAATEEVLRSGVFEIMNGEFSLLNDSAIYSASPDTTPDYRQIMATAAGLGLGVFAIRVRRPDAWHRLTHSPTSRA